MPEVLVFIDTCSFLCSSWDEKVGSYTFNAKKDDTFWNTELPSLFNMGRVILPNRNYEELCKHANSSEKPNLAERSQYVLEKLTPFIGKGQVELFGDVNDPFADAILLSIALKFRTTKNMAFITQDTDLAYDLKAIREFKSVRPRNGTGLKIRKLNREGKIVRWRSNTNIDERINPSMHSRTNTTTIKSQKHSPASKTAYNSGPKWYEA